MGPVLKIISYDLVANTPEADFLAASEAAGADISTLDGYIERRLFKDENGRWRDAVLWQSRAAADASEAGIPTLPGCARCIGFMDHDSFRIEHLEMVQSPNPRAA